MTAIPYEFVLAGITLLWILVRTIVCLRQDRIRWRRNCS